MVNLSPVGTVSSLATRAIAIIAPHYFSFTNRATEGGDVRVFENGDVYILE